MSCCIRIIVLPCRPGVFPGIAQVPQLDSSAYSLRRKRGLRNIVACMFGGLRFSFVWRAWSLGLNITVIKCQCLICLFLVCLVCMYAWRSTIPIQGRDSVRACYRFVFLILWPHFGGRGLSLKIRPAGRTLTVSVRPAGPIFDVGLRPPFWDRLLPRLWGLALLWLAACFFRGSLVGSRNVGGRLLWPVLWLPAASLFVVVHGRKKTAVEPVAAAHSVNTTQPE